MVATERQLRCDTPRDLAARATDRSVWGKGMAREDLYVKEMRRGGVDGALSANIVETPDTLDISVG